MGKRRVATLVRLAASVTVVASLLGGSPLYATTTPSTTASGTTAPVPSPSKPAAPAPIPAPSATETPAARQPADTNSEIDVTVDEQTEAFRRQLAERQARLDAFIAQLERLDKELEVASEEYNAANQRLVEMRERVNTAETDLINAREALRIQSELLGSRATSIYKQGSFAAVEVLLAADSISDLISRVKFLNTVGVRDADIAASLRGQKDLLEQQVNDLKNTEQAAASLEFELKARQIEVQTRISERQTMLATAQVDLVEMLDDEAARRRTEETQFLLAILSGAGDKGITVEPGSPVETALAYHGVPYLWGGATPSGFDCSGILLYVFRQHGVELPHYSGSQFLLGERVEASALMPGDAVFFGSPIHHVGMYIGGGYYLHSPRTGDFVKISKLADRNDFAGARRYPWRYRVGAPMNAVTNTTDALSGFTGKLAE